VTGIREGIVEYAPAEEVIRTRRVDEQMVRVYEALGICFGRKPRPHKVTSVKLDRPPWTYP